MTYGSNSWTVARHAKGTLKQRILTNGGEQEMLFITEGDVYRLIVRSKLPAAERFEHWLFDEVVPSIRKHGAYMTESLLERVQKEPGVIVELAQSLIRETNRSNALEAELGIAKPKADYFDQFVNAGDCTCIRYSGKQFNIPQNTFVQMMLDHKYLFRDQHDRLMPFADKLARGYFIVRDTYGRNGKMLQQTLITCKGKDHIRKQLQKWSVAA